jgi:hypothetical protein
MYAIEPADEFLVISAPVRRENFPDRPHTMTLLDDVTFESLGAVKQEIREWLGPDSVTPTRSPEHSAARDVLISVLIHSLAQELSDVRVRSQIQALLADLTTSDGRRFAD